MCNADTLRILYIEAKEGQEEEDYLSPADEESEQGDENPELMYRILPYTKITFLANKYKFVFVLDISPSTTSVVSWV